MDDPGLREGSAEGDRIVEQDCAPSAAGGRSGTAPAGYFEGEAAVRLGAEDRAGDGTETQSGLFPGGGGDGKRSLPIRAEGLPEAQEYRGMAVRITIALTIERSFLYACD